MAADTPAPVAGDAVGQEGLVDRIMPRPVVRSQARFQGVIFDVVSDDVDLGGQGLVDRDWIDHPGAVAVLALNHRDEIAVMRQYRHPVRSQLVEIPAGLLDVPGEDAQLAAARELAEEADLQAQRWDLLVDILNSPGCTNETIRIFLARDLTTIPADQRFMRTQEEAEIAIEWMPLDMAVNSALAGRFHNAALVTAVLAAYASRAQEWASLRPADSPMPYRRPSKSGQTAG